MIDIIAIQPFNNISEQLEGQYYPTLCDVLAAYNALFDHLDTTLENPLVPRLIKDVATAMYPKLSKYYGKTDEIKAFIINFSKFSFQNNFHLSTC